MNIDQHISRLLHYHDCVIIPEFGGFITQLRNAGINDKTHKISPPGKRIAFNKNLKQNDGLLANHLSHYEKISYAHAIGRVKSFVQDCNKEIFKGQGVYIQDVGRIFLDKDNNLQFEVDQKANHLLKSFGFSTIHVAPVKREMIYRLPVPSLKEVRSFPQKAKNWRKIAATIALPAIGLIGLITVNTFLIYGDKIQLGSLNPFERPAEFKMPAPVVSSTPPLNIFDIINPHELMIEYYEENKSEVLSSAEENSAPVAPVVADTKLIVEETATPDTETEAVEGNIMIVNNLQPKLFPFIDKNELVIEYYENNKNKILTAGDETESALSVEVLFTDDDGFVETPYYLQPPIFNFIDREELLVAYYEDNKDLIKSKISTGKNNLPSTDIQAAEVAAVATQAAAANVQPTEINEIVQPSVDVITPSSGPFHIVAGCFSVEKNAEKLLGELRLKGYADAIIPGKTKGLTVVSFGGFSSMADAREALKKVQRENSSAWVIKL